MSKKNMNKLSLFKTAKSRLMASVVGGVVVVAGIGSIWHYHSVKSAQQGYAHVISGPSIASVPGAGETTNNYNKDQQTQNNQKAAAAVKAGTSNVPTITKTTASDINGFLSDSDSPKKECPIKKTVVMYKPNPANCSISNLKLAHKSGVTAEELVCQGCSCPSLKLAGYTVGDLKNIGYTAKQLKKCGFTLNQLIAAGYSAKDLKDAGYSSDELKKAGFSAGELAAAGYTDTGYKNKITSDKCDPEALKKQRLSGVSAKQLKAQGCGVAALKAAGFSAKDLKDAGFSAKDLKDAGFSPKELKNAGFSAKDLKAAGFSAGQLKDAGFSAKDLKNAGYSPEQLREAGLSADALKAAGLPADQLKEAGYSKGDLLRGGYTPEESGYDNSAPVATPAAKTTAAKTPAATTSAVAMPSVNGNTAEARLKQLAVDQQARMTQQQRQDNINRMQAAMMGQSNKLLTGWGAENSQALQVAAPETTPVVDGGSAGSDQDKNLGPTYKAGTVMYAVLDTAINSDENTPIMAHIVDGALKGTKLLGTFSRTDKKLLISFKTLNIPSYDQSIGVKAVAIDPDTARTALAGQVDNHYLLRYGTLFASSFLEGIGDAFQSTTTSGSIFINTDVTMSEKPDATSATMQGLGKVGTKMGQSLAPVFNKNPTIKIGAGEGLGILLMSDLQLPQPLPETEADIATGGRTSY